MRTVGIDPLRGYLFAQHVLEQKAEALNFVPASSEERFSSAGSKWKPWAADDVAELVTFNRACGNDGGAALASGFADAGTLVVVTGQQPNLLVSPLYILYKALNCFERAKQLAKKTGRSVIPVFWIASDDHDFEELAQCLVVGSAGNSTNLADIVHRGNGVPVGAPAFSWRLADSRERILGRLDAVLGEEHQYAATRSFLDSALEPEATFEDVYARLLSEYLRATPVLFMAPRLRCIRRRQGEILTRDIDLNIKAMQAIESRSAQMREAGYSPQLRRNRDVLNFFMFKDGVRSRLVCRNGRIDVEHPVTRKPLGSMSVEELKQSLQQYPENFSPNVVTRPMIQDSALPTAMYVAGPGEIAYLAQLGDAYPLYDVEQAPVVLRKSVTLIDRATAEVLENKGNAVSTPDALLQAFAETTVLRAPFYMLAELQRSIEVKLKEINEQSPDHPHVDVAFLKTRNSIRRATDHLRRRLARHQAAHDGGYPGAAARALHMLFPSGGAQERLLSPLSFAGLYTPAELGAKLHQSIDWSNPEPEVTTV